MVVFVVGKDGKPLMPTKRFGKVRRLLKEKQAKIINRNPFTIQLLYETKHYTQPVKVGIDPGTTMGFAVVIDNGFDGKVIEKGEIRFRKDIPKLLLQRKEYRRSRRYRKTRYRKPRFLNRRRPEGWLVPSIRARFEHTIRWIEKLTKFLPNPEVIVEIARFDTQKLQTPNITGEEYQKGKLYGYANMMEYLLVRENGRCQLCGKEYGGNGNGWQIHHIIPRSNGGTDRPDNLALLHKECHDKIHRNPKLMNKLKKPKLYKESAHLNSFRIQLIKGLKAILEDRVKFTYGYLTKLHRSELGLPKTHANDAIAMTGFSKPKDISTLTVIRQVRKKKRSLYEAVPRKGRKKPNTESKRNPKNTKQLTTKDGSLWCLWDKIKVNGKVGFISGFTGNYAYIQDIDGNYIKMEGKNYKQVSLKQTTLIRRNNNWIEQAIAA